jgi:4-hydroxybenzoate polyprenyltransferase
MAAQLPATVRQVSSPVVDVAPERYATKGGTRLALIVLARPWQWVKNGLVLAALIFSHRLFNPRDAVLAAVALVAFCALSSFAYVLNDISDREADRLNPEKRDRPLARGDLTIAQAACFAIALGAIKTLLSIALGRYFLGIAAFYVALQVGYSLWAKHYKVLDVVAVAIGFVLRAFGGGVAIGAVVGRRGSSSSPLCWRCCWYSAGANTNW